MKRIPIQKKKGVLKKNNVNGFLSGTTDNSRFDESF